MVRVGRTASGVGEEASALFRQSRAPQRLCRRTCPLRTWVPPPRDDAEPEARDGLWPLRCSGRGWRPQPPGQGLDRFAGLVGRGPGDTEASPDAAPGQDRRPIVLDRGTWAGCLEGPAQRRTCCWPPRQARSEWSTPPGPQATPDAGYPPHGGSHRSIGQAACRRFDFDDGRVAAATGSGRLAPHLYSRGSGSRILNRAPPSGRRNYEVT